MGTDYAALIQLTTSLNKLVLITTAPRFEGIETFDAGLRQLLKPGCDFALLGAQLSNAVPVDALVQVQDNIGVHYALFHPGAQPDLLAVVGPYIPENVVPDQSAPAWISQRMVEAYYARICRVPEEKQLFTWLAGYGTLFGLGKAYRRIKVQMPFLDLPHRQPTHTTLAEPGQPISEAMLKAHQGALFDMLNAVSHGNSAGALQAKQRLLRVRPVAAGPQELKSWKKYLNALNGLLRYNAAYSSVGLRKLETIFKGCDAQIEALQNADACDIFLTQMLLWYCDCLGRYVQYNYNTLVQQVIAYINAHLAESLSLRVLAEQFGVNSSYLSGLFRRETQMTLTNFITQQRIYQAEQLLATTEESVSKIGERVGILDTNYFTHLFKRAHGVPPGQYRAGLKNTGEKTRKGEP